MKRKSRALSVLIVDDVANMRNMLASTLRAMDISDIKEASSGIEAIKSYKARQADIVFLDIQMPNINGLAVLRSLKQENPAAFVVIVSGESNVENVKEAVKLGAVGFIVKPYSLQKVEAMLNKAQKRKLAAG